MTNTNIRNLTCAIVMQAVEEFCNTTDRKERRAILKDLRSPYMDFITDGTSTIVAEQLELNPRAIAERLRQNNNVI